MRAPLCVLLVAVCALGNETSENEERGSKLPYIADAVGNELPRPSSLPATVGSPVNLLTPDRYEFYTFDESGELVKRLMTLEEIQAIVAAGEESEGLVTFANDNQPTIAFNFSQPPYTKVHNVVTNVQNVLKAQMEAHKNKPHFQPTLDTPDVSDSWSLILPSIFGNTGVDIGPDKIQNTGTFTTPETETIVLDHANNIEQNSLSKEGSNDIFTSSTVAEEELKSVPITEKIVISETEVKNESTTTSTSTTTTSTPKPVTVKSTTITTTTTRPTTTRKLTTTLRPTTTTVRLTTSTANVPSTTKVLSVTRVSSTPREPSTTRVPTTTNIPSTIKVKSTTLTPITKKITTTTKNKLTSTTVLPQITSTTAKPRITTTAKPIITTTVEPIITTSSVRPTTKIVKLTTTQKIIEDVFTSNLVNSDSSTAEPSTIQYEKISTFLPVSSLEYVTEKATSKPSHTTPVGISASTSKVSTSTKDNPVSITETKLIPQFIYSTPPTSNFIFIFPSTQKPNNEIENDKMNSTTITTQSVSPSTTISSTEFLSGEVSPQQHVTEKTSTEDVENEPIIPLFDVAQSISQIASDLGGNYRPIPTSSNLLDITKTTSVELESKENYDVDIPSDTSNTTNELLSSNITNNNVDNYIKISTLDPHAPNTKNETEELLTMNTIFTKNTTNKIEATTAVVFERNSTDSFLTESMSDLLSQVVDESPQTVATSERSSTEKILINTTETRAEAITDVPIITSTNGIKLETEKENHSSLIKFDIPSKPENRKENINIINKDDIKIVTRLQDTNISHNKNTDYVQISKINDKNNPSIVPVISILKNASNLNSTENHNTSISNNKFEKQTENSVSNHSFSTKSPSNVNFITQPSTSVDKIETTTDIEHLRNKFDIDDNINKLNKEKVKLPEFQPKIDDFKKKIQKVNIDDKELAAERNNSWKLISTVTPPKTNDIPKDKVKDHSADNNDHKDIVLEFPKENQGLEVTTKDLGEDIAQFTELCNELAFRYWNVIVENIDKRRSFVLSPYSITSMLAMMFMGARGATSGEMNEVLKLDDMVTFNPHFTLKNISDSIETSPESGISVSAFIRELYSDKNKGKVLRFYKERAQQFYNGHVEEIDFKLIGDKIRRRTNLLVKRYTWGKIPEYIKTSIINMQPPLAAFSANIFETDCSGSSVEGRDGEMYFVVSPNVRQRRLVPVPAVVYRNNFLAGYDPVLDATAAALGSTNSIVSTLFLMPGQQGNVVHSEDLEALEQRILDANPSTPAWNRLLRTLLPRIGLELQIPRFSHKSVFNVSSTLRTMGLKDLFDQEHADLGGLIGPSKDLYLSDMIQSTTFVTCGEGVVADQHHVEEYPETLDQQQMQSRRRSSRWAHDWDEPRDYQRAFHDPHDVGDAMHLPLHLRPRQARLPSRNAQPARLKFDRPFLFFVRHNPSGIILYVGRYNPRLLP